MKVCVSFKTPDAVHYALVEQIDEEMYPEQKLEALEVIGQYVKYGECITIEFDIKKGTAEVMKVQ